MCRCFILLPVKELPANPHIRFFTFFAYNIGKEVVGVTKMKYRVALTDFEQRLLINALMQFRNNALATGKPTEDINELILKVIDAPKKKWWR